MSPENKAHFESEKEAIHLLLTRIKDEIYLTFDACKTAHEIWEAIERLQQGKSLNIQDVKTSLFWEFGKFTSHDGEAMESYYTTDYTQLYDFLKYNQKEVDELRAERLAKSQDPLALMANSNNSFNYPVFCPDLPSSNPTTAMNMALALMAKAFKPNYSTPTNNNQRISSNPRNRQIVGEESGCSECSLESGCSECWKLEWGNCCSGRGLEAGIQLQAKEFDLMDAAVDLDKIEEVNANCILMANLQQASTSGTQTNKAPVYDSDGSAERSSILSTRAYYEPHQVPQKDSNVIYEVSIVEQGGGIVEQHPANVEETRVLYDSLYNSLATEVEKVNSVNCKLRETNANLTTKLARYKNQERCFEISQENWEQIEKVLSTVVIKNNVFLRLITTSS
ncbi:hypothetical protein Tco_0760795 [Tanacetum coccineum]